MRDINEIEFLSTEITEKISQKVNKYVEMILIDGGYYSPDDFDDFKDFVNKSEININVTGRYNYDLYFGDELILSWYIRYSDFSVNVEFYSDYGALSSVTIV